ADRCASNRYDKSLILKRQRRGKAKRWLYYLTKYYFLLFKTEGLCFGMQNSRECISSRYCR
ncbi:MAG: hypothetical protein WBV84_13925, partial [Nitrososphaeraceae archaeon]